MAYRLPCVVDSCEFDAEGESEDGVVERAKEHAAEEHPASETDERELRRNVERR